MKVRAFFSQFVFLLLAVTGSAYADPNDLCGTRSREDQFRDIALRVRGPLQVQAGAAAVTQSPRAARSSPPVARRPAQLIDADDLVAGLVESRPEVYGGTRVVNAARSDARGKFNYGVVAVETLETPQLVLKVAKASSYSTISHRAGQGAHETSFTGEFDGTDTRFQEYLRIQQTLANYGLAPRIYGVYANSELNFTLSETGILQDISAAGFGAPEEILRARKVGVLMEEIPAGWAINRSVPTPPYVSNWSLNDLARVLSRLALANDIIHELGIYSDDLQMLIDSQGNVQLIDVDSFRPSRPGESLDLAADMRRVIRRYSEVHRVTFTDAQVEQMLQRAGYQSHRPPPSPRPPGRQRSDYPSGDKIKHVGEIRSWRVWFEKTFEFAQKHFACS